MKKVALRSFVISGTIAAVGSAAEVRPQTRLF